MIPLHVHSTFSFLDGYGTPEQIVERAKENGFTSIALTDHGSVSGHVQLEKAAKENGIKPIFGCEFYIVESIQNNVRKKCHITILAKNQIGYGNLLQLVTDSYQKGFYYKPTVDVQMIKQYKEGLIVLSGCVFSLFNTHKEKTLSLARQFKDWFGEDFYLEIQPFDLDSSRQLNISLQEISNSENIPVVITQDIHYMTKEQTFMPQLLHCIRDLTRWEEGHPMKPQMFQADEKQIESWFDEYHPNLNKNLIKKGFNSTEEIAKKCNVVLPKGNLLKFSLPDKISKDDFLKKKINQGWLKRKLHKLPEDKLNVYKDRIHYEFDLICSKEYQDYFLIISDLIGWAKKQNIVVGPARGSAAGSLVSYCIGITEVDPIPWGLMFERFIDLNRFDLPDIDIDIEDQRRSEIKQYLIQKYGDPYVGNLCTFSRFKGKNSLDAIGKVFKVPRKKVEYIKKFLIERSGGDSRAKFTIEDTLNQFAQVKKVLKEFPKLKLASLLEGQIRHISMHAAGVILSEELITELAAKYGKPSDEESVISVDKYDAEYLGMVKIDILGLKTLTVFRLIMEKIGWKIDELYAIPLDDKKTFKGFQDNDLLGVFQFEGDAVRSVSAQLSSCLQDLTRLADVSALSRPGPLHCGGTTQYIKHVHGTGSVKSLHPLVDELTKESYGQIIYQEQVMMIMRKIGKLSWEDTSTLRKAMSKSLGVEYFNQFRIKFLKGAKQQNMPEEAANKIFDNCCTFGSWAFNKSHSISYAFLSYWSMYFKQHFFTEWCWAMLKTFGDNKEKRNHLMQEFEKKGGVIFAPKINNSEPSWIIEENAIRAGYMVIKGIGEKAANELHVQQQKSPFLSIEDVYARCNKKAINQRVLGTLQAANVLNWDGSEVKDYFGLNALSFQLNHTKRTHVLEQLTFGGERINLSVAGIIKERNLRNIFEVYASKHGVEADEEDIKSPELEDWVNLVLEDETSVIIATVNRFLYPKVKDIIWEAEKGDIYFIRGYKQADFRKIIVKEIINVSDKERKGEIKSGIFSKKIKDYSDITYTKTTSDNSSSSKKYGRRNAAQLRLDI